MFLNLGIKIIVLLLIFGFSQTQAYAKSKAKTYQSKHIQVSVKSKGGPDFTGIVKKNLDGVVNVYTLGGGTDNPPNMQNFIPQHDNSSGSGFIVSTDGYILTNHHVINGATDITVKLRDRRQFGAKLVGSDEATDVAVLKVSASGLSPLSIATAPQLKLGEWVVAIGSPFTIFDQSVTAGIVSGKGRNLERYPYIPFIQSDVVINRGSSGGPLLNTSGKVVAINSQIYSGTGMYMGISFAIPMDVVMHAFSQIKANGKVRRGWVGMEIEDVNNQIARSAGMSHPSGALVTALDESGPAQAAGLRVEDIITHYNGVTINNASELSPKIGMARIGSRATFKILRQGSPATIALEIGELTDFSSRADMPLLPPISRTPKIDSMPPADTDIRPPNRDYKLSPLPSIPQPPKADIMPPSDLNSVPPAARNYNLSPLPPIPQNPKLDMQPPADTDQMPPLDIDAQPRSAIKPPEYSQPRYTHPLQDPKYLDGMPPVDEDAMPPQNINSLERTISRIGLIVAELSPESSRYTDGYGIMVQKVMGFNSAIHAGDIILSIGNDMVQSITEFEQIIYRMTSRSTSKVLIQRGGARLLLPINIK